jgi:hypothetical protein
MSALKAVAPKNIVVISVGRAENVVHGIAKPALLNAVAPLNIPEKLTTLLTFQPLRFLLNAPVFANIFDILVTKPVAQPLISVVNASALSNIPDILVTFEVFHPPISGSAKSVQPLNIFVISTLVAGKVGRTFGTSVKVVQFKNAELKEFRPPFKPQVVVLLVVTLVKNAFALTIANLVTVPVLVTAEYTTCRGTLLPAREKV